MLRHEIQLKVNGSIYDLVVESREFLADVLRNKLFLTGTKESCALGDCGSCTIIMNGEAILSCITLAVEADGKELVTIEGIAPSVGELHPLQRNFSEQGAVQCGFCTPGMIISAKALLDKNPSPSEEEIKEGISGNTCRCGGYVKIIEAISAASKAMRMQEGS
jgi:carbon-monoxide dehydrogenase small subunit